MGVLERVLLELPLLIVLLVSTDREAMDGLKWVSHRTHKCVDLVSSCTPAKEPREGGGTYLRVDLDLEAGRLVLLFEVVEDGDRLLDLGHGHDGVDLGEWEGIASQLLADHMDGFK